MKEEIELIKQRNKRVEIDKAWEISKTRKVIIAIMTYIIVVIFLLTIRAPYPFLNALIPAIGFVLSTLTLPIIKKQWVKRHYKLDL
jgi:hypothetical protein